MQWVATSQIGRRGKIENGNSPLTSFVGLEEASRTGPCQVTSKKVLMVIFADEVEKCLIDGEVWRQD